LWINRRDQSHNGFAAESLLIAISNER